MLAEGDRVFSRCSWEGTQQGELMGIEPSGKHVFFTSMDEIRFSDGRIEEHWGVTDSMGLMMQLAAIPAPIEYPGGSSIYLDG